MLSLNDKIWAEKFFDKLEKKISLSAIKFRDTIPYETLDGVYDDMVKKDVTWWTNGFFGGLMWLMYKATGKEEYRITAERQEELLFPALGEFEKLVHDMGFMWGLTSLASYRITGNKKSRATAFYAASYLAARTNVRGKFISAWNGAEKNYSIIDCLMNMPLLYWASEEIADDRFKYVAMMQADMSIREHLREDGSVVHICVHDENSERVTETLAGQGYAVGSAWSRGQSWAMYGFLLSYRYTKEKRYLQASRAACDYFVKEVEKSDFRVLTDFCQPKETGYVDNTAAVCAACALIEISRILGDEGYLCVAVKLLKRLEEDCVFDNSSDGILQNCMISYSDGRETHLVYGDFFLAEALIKLLDGEFSIW